MRRLAILIHLLCLPTLLATGTPKPALAYNLPPCTRAEFRNLFDQIVEVQLEVDATISRVADLLEFAGAKLDARGDQGQTTPLCADDFDYQRLVIELNGDFVGRTALELGSVAAADNPYLQQLPSEQERIESLAKRLLSADRTAAPPPAERGVPKCAHDQLSALANLLPDFLNLLDRDRDEPLAAIDAFLRWRLTHVPLAPICRDGIELALQLSATATDAAAAHAISLVAPDAGNPYTSALADWKHRLNEWRIQLNERLARYSEESTIEAPLPACSLAQLTQAYGKLMPEYSNILSQGRQLQSDADLQDFSQTYFEFRGSNLARLPACAEAFAAAWEVRQLLGDLISSAARDLALAPGAVDPFADRLAAGDVSAAQLIDDMASRVEGAGQASAAEVIETAVACSPAESLLLQVYILPEFYAFGEAALAARTSEDTETLTKRSLAYRDLLWSELPRCAEAIELGLVMRRVAADFVAMLWLELAGVPPDAIAQVQTVADNMTRFSTRVAALDFDFAGTALSGTAWYISAERGANIRACGSTDCAIVATALSGDQVYVVDDSGAWYKVNLRDNQVGYIASFLVSRTPPS